MLGAAQRRRPLLPEIVLWTTASRHPSESQTSECSDLLSRSRATFVIVAQRQPGKLRVLAKIRQNSIVVITNVVYDNLEKKTPVARSAPATGISYSSLFSKFRSYKYATIINIRFPEGYATLRRSAGQRQHSIGLLASHAMTIPPKKIDVTIKTSSWKYISCHTDKNRYYT